RRLIATRPGLSFLGLCIRCRPPRLGHARLGGRMLYPLLGERAVLSFVRPLRDHPTLPSAKIDQSVDRATPIATTVCRPIVRTLIPSPCPCLASRLLSIVVINRLFPSWHGNAFSVNDVGHNVVL